MDSSCLRCAVGLACELTLRCARHSPSVVYCCVKLKVVRVSALPVAYVTGPPCSPPLLSKLNKNFLITFKDDIIGRVLRRVLKMAEAPLLSFVAIPSSNSE